MNPDQIRFTETNSADDSQGRTWGLDGNLFWFIAGGAFAFVVILLACFSALKMSFLLSSFLAALPLTLCVFYVFAFRQGKPPGYDVDCFDLWLNGRGFAPDAANRLKHPLHYVPESSQRPFRK
ncbi:MAG: hypothetical protein SFY81_02825 [Verrucomicrobiota bacterium]|nr:hypothetical protein [Verrucomicrobiota bacterium]